MNDVVLATCAGALRRMLEDEDEVPDPWGLLHHLEDALNELVKTAT